MDMMTTESKRRRLERSPELKAMVLAECERPGASVAKVAMRQCQPGSRMATT